jgi:membrane protein YqaA with SNARE-associated domain
MAIAIISWATAISSSDYSSSSVMASSEATVFGIPSEVTEHALIHLHPLDITSFLQTCHLAHTLVYGVDQYLGHQLFLAHPFDDPSRAFRYQPENALYNLKHKLQWRIQAKLITFTIG